MKKYKYYLFDFDGTLFDTSKPLEFVFKEAYKSVGIQIDPKMVGYLSRVPLSVSYKELGAPQTKAAWDKFIGKIEETLNSKESVEMSLPFEETLEFFNYVKTNSISIGIVTSNNSNHVRNILSFYDISLDLLKVIIGNVEANVPKPDPLPINVALKELGLTNQDDVVYIGDSKNDCLSAINAGIDYYFLDRENQGHYKDRAITNLMELFK